MDSFPKYALTFSWPFHFSVKLFFSTCFSSSSIIYYLHFSYLLQQNCKMLFIIFRCLLPPRRVFFNLVWPAWFFFSVLLDSVNLHDIFHKIRNGENGIFNFESRYSLMPFICRGQVQSAFINHWLIQTREYLNHNVWKRMSTRSKRKIG